MADSSVPSGVFTLFHLVEFGARMGGDEPDAEALKNIEPTLDAAVKGLKMAWPAVAETLALVKLHLDQGKAPSDAVAAAADHVRAAPVFMDDPQQRSET